MDHRGFRKLSYVPPVIREQDPQDEVLRSNLERMGDPGGATMGKFLQARDGYLLCYDEVKNITSYVYSIINPECQKTVEIKRQGHEQLIACRLMPNMCILRIELNQVLSALEVQGRSICSLLKTHHITGTIIIEDDPVLLNTPNPTPIPDAVFKIHVYEINSTTYYYDAFYFPNSPEVEKDPELSRCSIDIINYLSGFNFLSNPNVNFFTKTDKINLQMLLSALTKEKDITPLINALKAKDEQLKEKDNQLKEKEAEIQNLQFLLKSRNEPTMKKRRYNFSNDN